MNDPLPEHPVPCKQKRNSWSLEIQGLVNRPVSFALNDLPRLEQSSLTDDFRCLEGWVAEDCLWEGVPLGSPLNRAGVQSDARFVRIFGIDEGYECYVPLEQCDRELIALRLNGVRLPSSHGGPARLVWPEGEAECWQSVKWVCELEPVRDRPREDPARNLALTRLDNQAKNRLLLNPLSVVQGTKGPAPFRETYTL